jgi:hypothetical protein
LCHPYIDPHAGQRAVLLGTTHGTMNATTFEGVALTLG